MVARAWVLSGLLAACVLLSASGTAAGSTRSGVLSGFVLSAPAEPICMPRVPCMRPATGVVLAFKRADIVRARVTSDSDGSYRIRLASGTYAVSVTRPLGVRILKPTSVTISAGQLKRVTFYLDSGIR